MANPADFKVKNGLVVNTTASILSTVTSTSTTTGGVIVSGGVGIAKDVWIGGTLNVRSPTSATSTVTGAFQVVGGAGIQGDLYARNIYSNGVLLGSSANTSTTATNLAGGVQYQIPYQSTAGITTFILPPPTVNNSLLQFTTGTGFTWTNTTTVGGGYFFYSPLVDTFTSAGTTTTFTLSTVPVNKNILLVNIDGVSQLQSAFSLSGSSLIFTEIPTNGAVIDVHYASVLSTSTLPGQGAFGAIQYNYAGLISGTTFMSYNSTTGVVSITPNVQTIGTNSGSLQVIGGIGVWGGIFVSDTITATNFVGTLTGTVTTASNITGGLAGYIPMQTAAGRTSFIVAGSAGQLLQSQGTTSSFVTTTTLYVGNAVQAETIKGGGNGSLLYQSAPNVTSFLSTGTPGQLLMAAAGAPVFTNTSSIYVAAATQVNTIAQTTNATYYLNFVDSNNAASSAESIYTTSSFTVNAASGAVNLQTLSVNGSAFNSATNTANALYVVGGIYADGGLTVGSSGPVLFKGPVTFSGTATYVLSTNTFYTDNILELHTPPLGVAAPWFVDDGKDIGLRFHYYTNSTDTNAALVLANDSKYLEWYSSGYESVGGVFTSTTTYGIIKTGGIKLVGGTANSGNTSSGDLTVLGGVGIGQNLYVAGNINVAGTINASITGVSTTATNIAGGTAGQVPYQTGVGATSFYGPGSWGQFLISTGANAPTYQSTLTTVGGNIIITSNNAATSTITGALQIVNGGLGVGGATVIGGELSVVNGQYISVAGSGGGTRIRRDGGLNGLDLQTSFISRLFISDSGPVTITTSSSTFSTVTGALQVSGGVGIGGGLFVGGTFTNTGITVHNNNTAVATTNSGALQVVNGGVGIGGGIVVGGVSTVTNTTAASSTNTGALQVLGGVGVWGGLFVGGTFTNTGITVHNNNTAVATTNSGAVQIVNGGLGIGGGIVVGGVSTITNLSTVHSTATGALQVLGGVGVWGGMFVGANSTYTGILFVDNNTAVATTNSGALQVVNGGVGIGGGIVVGGVSTVTNTTAVSSTNTGALQVRGGVGIWGGIVSSGINTVTNATSATSTVTGALQIAGGLGVGGTIYSSGQIIVGGTSTNSTNTGALQVIGGVGISGGLFVGGIITGTNVFIGPWAAVTSTVATASLWPIMLNELSNQADGLRSVFPLLIDQTAVTGLIDSKDLQVMVNGQYLAPYVREKGLPWINTVNAYRGFRVVTTGTSQNWVVLYNAPDIGSQVVVSQVNISTTTQVRSYPYSASAIALGE